MADWADDANAANAAYLRESLAWRKSEGPSARGHCLNCEEVLAVGLRWCDDDCRIDWEKRHPTRSVGPASLRVAYWFSPSPKVTAQKPAAKKMEQQQPLRAHPPVKREPAVKIEPPVIEKAPAVIVQPPAVEKARRMEKTRIPGIYRLAQDVHYIKYDARPNGQRHQKMERVRGSLADAVRRQQELLAANPTPRAGKFARRVVNQLKGMS